MVYWSYLFIFLIWGTIWGFATRAIILNKGYIYDGQMWFWLGFLFGFIAAIVALAKPEYKHRDIYAENERSQQAQERNILNSGGWKCDCGRINAYYTSTCTCGKNKRDVLNARLNESKIVKSSNEQGTADEIKAFKQLLDDNVITQEEFEIKKRQLLGL